MGTWRPFTAIAAVMLCLVLAGCGTCAGSNVAAGPVLTVTDHGWLASHPGRDVTVCFDQTCRKLQKPDDGATAVVETTVVGRTPVSKSSSSYPVTLTITGSDRQGVPHRQQVTVTMARSSGHAFCLGCGCGSAPSSTAHVDLRADGRLRGADG